MKRMLLLVVICILPLMSLFATNLSTINSIFQAMEATALIRSTAAGDTLIGTGFFISEEYLIANASTVQNAQRVAVESRGLWHAAQVVAVHYSLDFALLRIPDYDSFHYFTFARTNPEEPQIRVNNLAYDPYFSNKLDIIDSRGIINTHYTIEDNPALFQVDFNMLSHNYGGPIIDENYNIVGLLVGKNISLQIDTRQMIDRNASFGVKGDYLARVASIYTRVNYYYDPSSTTPSATPLITGPAAAPPKRPTELETDNSIESKKISSDIFSDDRRPPTIPTTPRVTPYRDDSVGHDMSERDILIRENTERDRLDRERLQRERAERERELREQREREVRAQQERERLQREQAAREQQERERLQREREAREQQERDRQQREREAREQQERDRLQREREAREQQERDRLQRERQAAEQQERDRIQRENIERERIQREQNTVPVAPTTRPTTRG